MPLLKKTFSLEEANRMLPLVRKIVQDIAETFRALQNMQEELAALSARPSAPRIESQARLNHLQQSLESSVEKLENLLSELESLGVELKDFSKGLVDFPSRRGGRPVYLCWMLGEDSIRFWHTLEGGFAARAPLEHTFH